MSMEATKALLEEEIGGLEFEINHCQIALERNLKSNEEITATMAKCQERLASHREVLRILKKN